MSVNWYVCILLQPIKQIISRRFGQLQEWSGNNELVFCVLFFGFFVFCFLLFTFSFLFSFLFFFFFFFFLQGVKKLTFEFLFKRTYFINIFSTPSQGQDVTQGQFFSRALTGWNSEFSFS